MCVGGGTTLCIKARCIVSNASVTCVIMSIERYNFSENNFSCWVFTTLDNIKLYRLREFVILLGHTKVWRDEEIIENTISSGRDESYDYDLHGAIIDEQCELSMTSLFETLDLGIVDEKFLYKWNSLPGKLTSRWPNDEPFIVEAGLRKMMAKSEHMDFLTGTVLPRILDIDSPADDVTYAAKTVTHTFNGHQFLSYKTLETGIIYKLDDFAAWFGLNEKGYDVINKAEWTRWGSLMLQPSALDFPDDTIFVSELGLHEFVSKFEPKKTMYGNDQPARIKNLYLLSETVLPRLRCCDHPIPYNVRYERHTTTYWNKNNYSYEIQC